MGCGFSLPSKNFGFSDVASGQIVLVKSASRDDCVRVGQIPRTATDRLLCNEQSYISIVLGWMNKSPPRLRLCIGHPNAWETLEVFIPF